LADTPLTVESFSIGAPFGFGYGHHLGTLDGRPAALHTGDNPCYKSLVGWLPDGVGIVTLSNDDSIEWEDVLRQVL
jgi:hypothetical protein